MFIATVVYLIEKIRKMINVISGKAANFYPTVFCTFGLKNKIYERFTQEQSWVLKSNPRELEQNYYDGPKIEYSFIKTVCI